MNKLLIIILAIFLFQCANSDQEKEAALKKELMRLHDKEMAKMDKIYLYKDSLIKLRNLTSSELDMNLITKQIESLERADKAMMDWMHNYEEPSIEMKHEDKITYFNNKTREMTSVKHIMNNSLDSAAKMIKKYTK